VGVSTIINSVKVERGRVVSTPMLKSIPKFASSEESEKEQEQSGQRNGVVDLSEKRSAQNLGVTGNNSRPVAQAYGGEAERRSWRKTLPGLLAQVAVFQTTAGPIGFLALEHISYPTMVLGKVRQF
jgi:UDP-galactose transporter B1